MRITRSIAYSICNPCITAYIPVENSISYTLYIAIEQYNVLCVTVLSLTCIQHGISIVTLPIYIYIYIYIYTYIYIYIAYRLYTYKLHQIKGILYIYITILYYRHTLRYHSVNRHTYTCLPSTVR